MAGAQRIMPASGGSASTIPSLLALDARLAELGIALGSRDASAVVAAADAVHAALEDAAVALRSPGVMSAPLRRHLAQAAARLAAQRNALNRAATSVDRAIEVLLPQPGASAPLYGTAGQMQRALPSRAGSLRA